MTTPDLIIENRYATTPRFAKEWLTDFRADDGRFFGDPGMAKVERHGHMVLREVATPMGPMKMTVDIAKDDAWVVRGKQHTPDGATLFTFQIDESVRGQEGATLHRVEFRILPVAPSIAAMVPQLIEGWKASLTSGFVAIKRELEQAAAAGKSPIA